MPMDAKGQEYHEELVQQIIDAGRYLIEHAESMVDAEWVKEVQEREES